MIEVENDEDHILLEVPIDMGNGIFVFVDFNIESVGGVRPSKKWPTTFEGWQRFIKWVFDKDLPRPEVDD